MYLDYCNIRLYDKYFLKKSKTYHNIDYDQID